MNSSGVEYLVVGGYAVNYYGYARATADLHIWIGITPGNAETAAGVLREFGFVQAQAAIFLERGKVIRMGVPPVRLKMLTTISGVELADCYVRRHQAELDGVSVNFIRLDDLKRNKTASGRLEGPIGPGATVSEPNRKFLFPAK